MITGNHKNVCYQVCMYISCTCVYMIQLSQSVEWYFLCFSVCMFHFFLRQINSFFLKLGRDLFGIDLVFTDTHRHFSHLSLFSNGIFLVHCSVFSYQTMLRSSWHDSDGHLTKKYFDSMFYSARSYSSVLLDSFSGMFLYLLKTV